MYVTKGIQFRVLRVALNPGDFITKIPRTESFFKDTSNMMTFMPIAMQKDSSTWMEQFSQKNYPFIKVLEVFIIRPNITILSFFK